MHSKFMLLVPAVLGLLALAGCGVGPQPATVAPTAITAPTATRTGPITPAPIGGTPLPVATLTPAATPTRPAATPSSAPTEAASPTEGTGGADLTPTGTPAMTDETPTGGATTPGTTPTGGASPTGVTVEVITFNVWQDFMPSVGSGGPPLYASVELNVTNGGTAPLREVLATRIVIVRPDGQVVLDRGLQGGPPDPAAGTPLAPGETRPYSYRSASADVSPTMTENEAVSGALTLSFDGIEQTVPLPATRVFFTQ